MCSDLLLKHWFTITNLSLLFIRRWTIRARVTNKANVRTWSNSKGEGKLFSFEVLDESVSRKVLTFACNMPIYWMIHMTRFFFPSLLYSFNETFWSTGRNQDYCLQQRSGQIFLSSGARQGECISLIHIRSVNDKSLEILYKIDNF